MRKLAVFSAGFAGALLLTAYILPEGWRFWAALVAVLLAGLSALLFKEKLRLRALLILAGFALGLVYHGGYDLLFCRRLESLAGETREIEVTALDYAVPTDLGCRVDARLDGGKISLYLHEEVDIKPGDQLRLTAELASADRVGGEEIDYYKSVGIRLLAYQDGELTLSRPEKPGFRFWFVMTRRALSDKLEEIAPADSAPFMRALILGDRAALDGDEALYSDLDRSGIRHVIAISGMHLSFLVAMVRLLCGRRRRTAFVCVPVILAFMALVGFPVSVVRAGIMQIMLLIAPLLRRENDPITALSAAGLVLLLLNPWSVCSASFQLSFAAVAGILLLTGPLYKKLWAALPKKGVLAHKLSRACLRFLISGLSSTAGAMVFTAPLMALHFGSVSVIAPLTNILCLWAVSLAFMLGLAACLLALIWAPLGAALAWLCAWPVRYVLFVSGLLADLPFAALYTVSRYTLFFLCFVYVLLLILLFFRKQVKRPFVPLCCGLLGLCLTILFSTLDGRGADMLFTVLDVGQGQSIVLRSGGMNAVIDCGGDQDNPGNLAADYLAGFGEDRVDVLILTHWHDDHVNGVEQLLHRTDVQYLIVPEGTDDEDENMERILNLASGEAEICFVDRIMNVEMGEVDITIYPPIATNSENEACLTVLSACGAYETLVTGDMPARLERRLLERHSLPDIELLVAGHHGSKSSCGKEILAATKPETVFISVGYNSYGHPAEETLDRIARAGAQVYRTDQNGNCTVRIEHGKESRG